VSAAVVADAGRGAQLIMLAPQAEPTAIISDISDTCHTRLGEDVYIPVADRARVMRESTAVEGESGSGVSAFNSSI
jgi:hypothetical protein